MSNALGATLHPSLDKRKYPRKGQPIKNRSRKKYSYKSFPAGGIGRAILRVR